VEGPSKRDYIFEVIEALLRILAQDDALLELKFLEKLN